MKLDDKLLRSLLGTFLFFINVYKTIYHYKISITVNVANNTWKTE